MKTMRATGAALLMCFGSSLWTSSLSAQPQQDTVELILSHLPAPVSAGAGGEMRPSPDYESLEKQAAPSARSVLPLTRSEVWAVPRQNADAVKDAAAKQGVVVTELGADWNRLFRLASADMIISEKQRSLLNLAKAASTTVTTSTMEAPPPPTIEYALTKEVDGTNKIGVTLADGSVITMTRTNLTVTPSLYIWHGRGDYLGALVTIMWWPDGKITGHVRHGGRIFNIKHMGGSHVALVETNESLMPQDHAPMRVRTRTRSDDPNAHDNPLVQRADAGPLGEPKALDLFAPARKAWVRQQQQHASAADVAGHAKPLLGAASSSRGAAGEDVVIDVIVAYTPKVATHYADVRRELVDLSIVEANDSFRRSSIGNVKLRLVHAYQTDYAEEGAHFDHVWRFADKGDGYMEEIHALRDKHRADVAVLIVDDPSGCGLATRVYADADDAFAVVHHECAAATYSLAHEIGHIIGARHDLALDKTMTPFAYGHGYVNGVKWRDIMSYKDSCGGCPRLPVWSSPHVTVDGEVAGTPELDNARVIAEQAPRVAAFR